jgi:Protein of unknown function (DUF3175)
MAKQASKSKQATKSKRQRTGGRKQSARGRTERKRGAATGRRGGQRWSAEVTEHSDALTLERGVFTWKDPKRIAASLKRSAERSRRRKADPYRSAVSMLTFYINRAGRTLPAARKKNLMRAKDELRKQFARG